MFELPYVTAVNEGSAYEIGWQRGIFVNGIPDYKAFLTQPPQDGPALTKEEAQHRIALLESACPGLRDELQGFADALGAPVEALFQLRSCVQSNPCACSLVSVPPSRSADGHTYVARSYEYNADDELFLSITRETGKFAHMGFSLFQVGRFDGINEKGLCVAIASCECVRSSENELEGVRFPIATRRILDSCSTVTEALAVLDVMPLADNFNYILADVSGDSAVVETLCDKGVCSKVVRRADGPLFAMNHYISAEHRAIAPQKKGFSAVRQQRLEAFFQEKEKVSAEDLRTLLSTPIPNGLCCSDYSNWFGTLRSMLFDATEKRLSVCFGNPETQPWFDVDWQAPAGFQVTMVPIEDVPIDNLYWQEQ